MRDNVPTLLVAGKDIGSGFGQQWAVKSLKLLGVSTVVAESFSPTFRLNLIRLGILPLQLKNGVNIIDLKLNGEEVFNFAGLGDIDHPRAEVMMTIEHKDDVERYMVVAMIDTLDELSIYSHGSLLAMALRERSL